MNFNYSDRILQCFPYPFIGLKGCHNDSNSGLYINSLEGVSFKRLSKLLDGETHKVDDLYAKVHDKSIIEMYHDILQAIQVKDFTFNYITGEHLVGKLGDDFGVDFNNEIGYIVKKVCDDPFTVLKVDYIEFIPNCDVTTHFYIEDGNNVYKKKIKLTGGIPNRIPINYATMSHSFKIYLKNCEWYIKSEKCSTCSCGHYYCKEDCCYHCPSCFSAYPYRQIDLYQPDYGYNGIVIKGACVCDPSKLICQFSDLFGLALMYKIGINLMLEALNSVGICDYLIYSDDSIVDNLKRWRGGVDALTGYTVKGEYAKILDTNVNMIDLSNYNTECIDCHGLTVRNVFP